MYYRIVLLAFLTFNRLVATAGDGEYAVSRISPSLLKGANAIIRLQDSRFEINNLKNVVYTEHFVITILNESTDELAEFYRWYDRFCQINSVEGFLYDANGKQLKKMKYRDLEDRSGSVTEDLINDNRYKRHNFYYKVYPYTIEYNVVTEYKSSFFFPRWIPQSKENISVEHSRFSMICPEDYHFRYRAFNYSGEPVITKEKNKTVSTWEVKNIPARIQESYGPPWRELTTCVYFGPTDFQMEDYKGNMSSWGEFGKFFYELNRNRDQLPENVRQTVHQLTDGKSDKEKIVLLYQYLQKSTRYISIQLGIGGYQPLEASFVASKGYGDCKALSNYMFSLLKEAGVRSIYSLVNSGRGSKFSIKDFPNDEFDHIILCVPLSKDTIWLECTSQTLPAGYLSSFTDDRYVLTAEENGGHLVRTPRYNAEDNSETRHVKGVLKEDGTLSINVSTNYRALQQDGIFRVINTETKDKIKEYLHRQLDFATYDINEFDYKQTPGLIPAIYETLDITVKNYGTVTGKRLFIVPNVMTRTSQQFGTDSTRKYDVVLDMAFHDVDSVEITLPKGYEAESMPKDVLVKSQFGQYSCTVKLSGNKLNYYRSFERFNGRFPANSYEDLRQFYEAIYKADRNRVVLVKTNN